MPFQVFSQRHTLQGQTYSTYLLTDGEGGSAAEIWPELGCNCLSWRVNTTQGPLELLYVHPDWQVSPVPNRCGIPILFPFPNRIRRGTFSWAGREYRLPLNDPGRRNAIHGFACRQPWRVRSFSQRDGLATLTAEFQLSVDVPNGPEVWPGDAWFTLRFYLTRDMLALAATIVNPGSEPVPIGLGYHPYFRVPFSKSGSAADCVVHVAAANCWELIDSIPTGHIVAVDSVRDLTTPRAVSALTLDDVYTGFDLVGEGKPMARRGWLQEQGIGRVEVWTSPRFRELVVFTPEHRQAICLEPYTCATDAINLHAAGIDAGLIVLPPGEKITEFVAFRFVPEGNDPDRVQLWDLPADSIQG